MCVSEKIYFKKKRPNLGMIYFIPKLCIQNNLPNTIKCEKCFFFFFEFEYRIKKMKSEYTTF